MCFAVHLLMQIFAGAQFSWRRGLLNINVWYTRQISVFKWGNLECKRLPDPNKFWQVQIVLGRTRETKWVHFSGVRGWGWKRGDLTMHVLAVSLNPLPGPPFPLCPLSLPSPPSAIASVRRRPSFPTSGNMKWNMQKLQLIRAMLTTPRHQGLGGHQRHTRCRARHNKDTVLRDHLWQTWRRACIRVNTPQTNLILNLLWRSTT